MRRVSPLLALVFVALAGTRALAESQNGGAAISIDPQGYRLPLAIAAEPDSGALVLIQDTRSGSNDLYVQRTDRHGRPLLGAGGQRVWTAPFGQSPAGTVADGSGGIVFAWSQPGAGTGLDVYVQRVQSDGSLAFGPGGLLVCNAVGDQSSALVAPAQSSSFWVEWTDARAGVANQADVYAQRVTFAGAVQLAANGVPLNTPAYRSPSGSFVNIAPDLSGGLLAAWGVYSPVSARAQRIGPLGVAKFGAAGAAVGIAGDQDAFVAPDGSGGMWAWNTRVSGSLYTPYAYHLTSTGVSSFPSGAKVHSANTEDFELVGVRDASGGCFFYGINVYDPEPSISNSFRQQIDGSGNLLDGTDGVSYGLAPALLSVFDTGSGVVTVIQEYLINSAGGQNRVQRYAYDGTPQLPGTGVVVGRLGPSFNTTYFAATGSADNLVMEAQADDRYTSPTQTFNYQVFGQALDASGNPLWDDAENPVLGSVKDFPGDQGGLVRATWNASVADAPAAKRVVGYHGWRALETTAAARLAGRHAGAAGAFVDGGRHYLFAASQYWELVGGESAAQLPNYSLSMPTGQDSTAAGSADESFMVEAYDDSSHHWYSSVLTAHSTDNLAPAVPAPFTGEYRGGTTFLLWHANTESDLAGYHLYRGSSPGFVPGPGNRIATLSSPGFDDPAGSPEVYKLSAFDVHGNESGYATLTPAGTSGVGGATVRELAFTLASGNPARAGATLRLALPAATHARVAIYDATGRELRRLVDGDEPAGTQTIEWDGGDGSGRALASGLYFARLEIAGSRRVVRLALTR